MPRINSLPANASVDQAITRFGHQHGCIPVPLVATSYDIAITAGVADVVARRTFRNAETKTIEALLTFPIPVDAALYALQARIGERTLNAVARSRQEARATYEDAIDRGKTAVLHEELFRGVHLLSVAHVAPGSEIEVTLRFALPLSYIDGRTLLRIPTTVGDVYGSSGLPDSDELVAGGTVLAADVSVSSDSGRAALLGHELRDGRARVSLDAPIDVEIANWVSRPITSRAADGRTFELNIEPAPHGESDIDAVILVDHSGSMGGRCAGATALTKFEALLLGLSEAGNDLRPSDRLNLWDFDSEPRDLGTVRGDHWSRLIKQLAGPAGGTEIGHAIEAVLAQRKARDIVLITDGKSHAVPVQELARSGARFTVVLIGEDSLDANVGYLAALTGGQIFIPPEADVAAGIRSAFRTLRRPHSVAEPATEGLRACRSGMQISVSYAPAAAEIDEPVRTRACAAFAASLLLPRLAEAEATQLALAEGLVTHLTSLVLVDDAGDSQAGLPVTRKVLLPSPAAGHVVACARQPARSGLRLQRTVETGPVRKMYDERRMAVRYSEPPKLEVPEAASSARAPDIAAPRQNSLPALNLAQLPGRIDWRTQGVRLVEGNMIGLDPDVADAIDAAARLDQVKRVAKRFGISARALVIALLARVAARDDRFADRVARAILQKVKPRNAAVVADVLGLSRRARAAP